MAEQGPSGNATRAEQFASVAPLVVCGLAAVAFLGGVTGRDPFAVLLGEAAVAPLTSAWLVLISLAIFLSTGEETSGPGRWLATAVVAIGAGAAALSLAGTGLGFDLRLRELGLAPASIAHLVLLGLAAALVDIETGSNRRPTEILAFFSLALSVYLIFGQLTGVASLDSTSTGFNLGIAGLFAFLAIALLASRPTAGSAGLLTSETPGGRVARRLLPLSVLGPIALGAVALFAERGGAIHLGGALPLVVAVAMVVATGIAGWVAEGVDRDDTRAQFAAKLRVGSEQDKLVEGRRAGERRLVAQAAIGRVFAEADSVRGTLSRLLEAVGEHLDWEAAAVWTLDLDASVLRCVEVWHAPSSPLSGFMDATRDVSVRRGFGLPGRVWASGESTWITNVAQEANFLRVEIAAEEGLRTALGVPIRWRGELLGVLEFFAREARGRDEEIVQMMQAIANQVGQFVERKRVEDRLREEIITLEAVSRLGPLLSAELDLEKLVQALTDAATKLVGAQFGTFFRYHQDNGSEGGHTAYASSAALRDAFGLERPAKVLVPTFSSDGPLRIQDLRREARDGDRVPSFGANAPPGSIASYLAVPVVSRSGHVMGSLALAHTEPGVFTLREERIAVGLAAQVAVAIDNAQLYEAERRARDEAETANRAKDEFLAMLGHELRNPLGAIRNSVQALEVSQATTEAGQMLCTIIERQTETLAHLVDDLLDVSRLISGKIQLRRRVVDWKDLTEQALESLRAGGKAARHFVHLTGESVLVDGDPVRLEQVVTNLVENAIKYTQAGGEIEVAVERVGEQGQLRVRDNGQGIEPELLPKIFEVFTQGRQSLDRSKGGMGLGLALVRSLAELHGGTVEVESAGPGKGSEFRVRLPARPQAEQRPVEATPGTAPFTSRHVLIIEDHGDSRESLRILLEAAGHRVDVAQNGFDGLEMALSRRPEIAIIDIGIPGMDGYQVAREIRAADGGERTYLVALTGYGQPIDRRQALESGFNEHMVKPVDRDRLMRMVVDIEPADARPD
jgi:signal transduction histidine kinase/ActR/RegA family two-component response regulator